MFNNVCRKMKSNTQSAEIFRIGSAFGLRKSSMSFGNLIAFLICIFFSANTWAQIPVPVITQNNSPTCGETVNLTASCQGGTPSGYKYHWFSDAACTNEISSGVTGSNYENLAINIYDGLTIYCRLRKTTTETVINNFPYSGNEQVYDVPVGYVSFKFEVWGAQGGGRQDCGNGGNGGKGGYSKGTLDASSGISSIYVYVGGMGYCGPSSRGIAQGGWNGGGSSWRGANAAAGGGGGTDIRINGNTFYHRIIVAGGGGGGGEDPGDTAGYGGGENGGNESGGHNNPGVGGSQTAAGLGGAFGLGANTRCDGGGGGGGWYGGGTNKGTQTIPTSDDDSDAGGAAGGSGYVYTSSTAGNYPSGCRLNSSLYLTSAQTIAGNTLFPATGGGNETGHSGNGYARIITTYYPTGRAGSITLHSYVDDPTSIADAADCGSAIVSAVAPDGCVIDWYDAPTGGNLLAQGSDTYTAMASGTYYAESRKSAGCVSENRIAVEATVWGFNSGTISGSATRFQGTTGDISITTTTPASGKPDITYQWYMNGSEITGATYENYTIPSATIAGLPVGEYVFTRKAKNNCDDGNFELSSGSFLLIIVNPSGGTSETCGNGLVLYCTPSGTSSGTGSTTSPMDIVTALTTAGNYSSRTADDPAIIRMAAGEYTVNGTTLNLVDNLIIDGGWDASSAGIWTKGTGETNLNGTFGTVTSGSSDNAAIHRIAIRSEGKQNWKLQDLSVNVTGYGSSDCHSTSKKGNSVYGLYMTNTSDGDELIRVKINVGNGGAAVQKSQDGSAAAGNNGGSYRTAGAAKGSSDRMLGKAGGSGGLAGTNGVSGGYGTSGKGGGQKGYDGNGASSPNGIGGSGGQAVSDTKKNPGGNGTNGVPGVTATTKKSGTNVLNSYGTYFIPGKGLDGEDGTGGGGGGGGGGSCGCGGRYWGETSYTGGTGGGGGGGGVGGHGGTGGAGGGGSFGIYCYNLSSLPVMQDVKITKGNAGSGASGQKGQQGGTGGSGGAGKRNSNATGSNCNNDDNHKGGDGGAGGVGGNGADGDKGPNGEAFKIVVVPASGSPTKKDAADGVVTDFSTILTSIDYGISSKKGCTNSQIALARSGGSWSGQYGTLVNDVTESSSSYSTDNESIIVGYSALGSFAPTSDGRKVFITQERNIGEIDGTDEFDAGESGNYLYDESLSSGDIMYWSLVSEDGATQYSTAVSVYDGTDGNTFSVNSTVLGLTPGDYYIKLEVDNNCCGMSVPIWKSITVKEPSLLPIELTSFSAECDGKSSLVEWTTATERNNDHFVLERSVDAINFAEIARLAGAGNSIEPQDYTYTDYDIRNGDNYYRLWQVDYDGTRTASEIIVATCIGETLDAPEVLAYPNPFSGELTVVLENFGNSKARIEVYDMLGAVVKVVDIDSSTQSNAVLNLSNLPNAAYNIRVRTKDFVINKNVVKN